MYHKTHTHTHTHHIHTHNTHTHTQVRVVYNLRNCLWLGKMEMFVFDIVLDDTLLGNKRWTIQVIKRFLYLFKKQTTNTQFNIHKCRMYLRNTRKSKIYISCRLTRIVIEHLTFHKMSRYNKLLKLVTALSIKIKWTTYVLIKVYIIFQYRPLWVFF